MPPVTAPSRCGAPTIASRKSVPPGRTNAPEQRKWAPSKLLELLVAVQAIRSLPTVFPPLTRGLVAANWSPALIGLLADFCFGGLSTNSKVDPFETSVKVIVVGPVAPSAGTARRSSPASAPDRYSAVTALRVSTAMMRFIRFLPGASEIG